MKGHAQNDKIQVIGLNLFLKFLNELFECFIDSVFGDELLFFNIEIQLLCTIIIIQTRQWHSVLLNCCGAYTIHMAIAGVLFLYLLSI